VGEVSVSGEVSSGVAAGAGESVTAAGVGVGAVSSAGAAADAACTGRSISHRASVVISATASACDERRLM